ncbi:MAG: hypothetical protein OEY25_04790 [Candidatus Aminicenantes bacterium]|nr:hypothetical protein [Candidatus Aminicenantes bacterium]
MKKVLTVGVILLLFFSVAHLQAQWIKLFGGIDSDTAYLIQEASDGGYLVAGTSRLDVSNFSYLLVVKLDSNGTMEWHKSYTGSTYISLLMIQETADGGCILGGSSATFNPEEEAVWVLKLTPGGDIDWSESYGRIVNGYTRSIQPTSDGGYIFAGSTEMAEIGGQDIWVSKFTATLDVEWQRAYGGSDVLTIYDNPIAPTIVYDDEDVCSVQPTIDGGYILTGLYRDPLESDWEALISKLDASGNIEWKQTYLGYFGANCVYSVQQTINRGFVFAGSSFNLVPGSSSLEISKDILVLKLDPEGLLEWKRTFGGSDNDCAYSIQQTEDGGFILKGTSISYGLGEGDILIMKLSSSGEIEWQKTYGTCTKEEAHSLLQTSDGGYLASGYIYSFGAGARDFLLLKLLPDGLISSPCRFINDSFLMSMNAFVYSEDADLQTGFSGIILGQTAPSFALQSTALNEYELCSSNPLLAVRATEGGTTNPPPDTYVSNLGEKITAWAVTEDGRFVGWSGDVTDENLHIDITMSYDKSVCANFAQREYTLIINTGEGGTTDPQPGAHMYDYGTIITVTAIPEGGYKFSEWSGDASGTVNPVELTLNSNKSLIANFIPVIPEEEESWLDKIFKIRTCAIATATYGSPEHPHVKVLREFRDRYLVESRLGRRFVELYYKYSPAAAEFISKHKVIRMGVRHQLLPVIAFSYSMVRFGPIVTAAIIIFVFIVPISSISLWRRKRIRNA